MVINYRRELIAQTLDDNWIHFIYVRKFCRRPPSDVTVPQSKVAVWLRLNVVLWCTSEACKYSMQ